MWFFKKVEILRCGSVYCESYGTVQCCDISYGAVRCGFENRKSYGARFGAFLKSREREGVVRCFHVP